MKKHIFGILLAATMFAACATQQEKDERRARVSAAVGEAVNSRHLRIEVNEMSTQRYGTRMVSPEFYVELRGDTLMSYLPYMGQVHKAPFSSPPIGLNFETVATNWAVTQPKRHMTRMDLDAKTIDDRHHYSIEIFETGKAYIHVLSQYRDAISFWGEMVLP